MEGVIGGLIGIEPMAVSPNKQKSDLGTVRDFLGNSFLFRE
jgi:hypothetical protein